MDRGILVIIAVYLIALPVLFRPVIHGVDPIGYYAWLKAAVVDHTLNVAQTFDHYIKVVPEFSGGIDPTIVTPTGYRHNQWAAGSAILWAPLYLVAHTLTSLAQLAGAPIQADGYTWPYLLAASFSSTLYGLAAVLFTYRMVRAYFGAFAATLATLAAWLATPLVFYMYSSPLMSHANDAFACTLTIYVWWMGRETLTRRNGVFLGMAIGLATWVRTQNVILLAVLFCLIAVQTVIALRRGQRIKVRAIIVHAAFVIVGTALTLIPLMLFWRVVYGGWVMNTYAASQPADPFDWRAPHVLQVLFSQERGLFIWSPVTVFVLWGYWQFGKRDRPLVLFLGLFLLGELYVISSWYAWSGATSFGPRFFSNMLAPFALGLGAFIYSLKRTPRWVLACVCAAFIIWNTLLIVQYSLELIPHTGAVDFEQVIRNQFLVIPQNIERVIHALLYRR